MTQAFSIRDARPSDAPFLAECIFAGMHLYDFEEIVNDDLSDALERITECEGREDTLYTYSRTRLAEVGGKPAGALLSYPGELYKDLKEKTFREYWPDFFLYTVMMSPKRTLENTTWIPWPFTRNTAAWASAAPSWKTASKSASQKASPR